MEDVEHSSARNRWASGEPLREPLRSEILSLDVERAQARIAHAIGIIQRAAPLPHEENRRYRCLCCLIIKIAVALGNDAP
jgi:hypothetical protein